MRRILYLWVPHLHTRVEQGWDAALKGQPVVVVAGRFQRGMVIDASPEAEAMGALAGMTWRHAHRRCPTARFIRYERPRYAPVVEQIGAVLTRYTPWAELLAGSEEEFFADLGAGDPAEGVQLAARIRADIAAELELETRAAVAAGKFPARTLCRGYDQRPTTNDEEPTNLTGCTGSAGWEDGVGENIPLHPIHPVHPVKSVGSSSLVVGRSSFVELRPLSIDTLWDVKPEVRERMLLLGIRTLGQLAVVPQRLLVDQFGPAGRWYRLLARGIDHRRVAAWQPSPTLVETGFVHDDEPTLPILEEILDDLAGRLSERLLYVGQYGRTLTLVVHLEGGDRRFATHHLKAPTHLRRHLWETAMALLGRSESTPRLVALELRVGGLGARGVLQLSIFGEMERGPALRAAVARIQDRFGERAVRNAVQLLAELQFQS